MNIAENILKHSLQNVYFLTGTALAGKTTLAAELARKHGLIPYYEDWNGESFRTFQSICDATYQPESTKHPQTDWEAYFSRTLEEFLADTTRIKKNNEYMEFAIIDLIKLSQGGRVITDLPIPIRLVTQIADDHRIVCMLASPELVTCANYGKRESHKAFLDCLMSLKDPEKKIAVQDQLFRIEVEKIYQEAQQYHLFRIIRTEESTVANTLPLVEEHFRL